MYRLTPIASAFAVAGMLACSTAEAVQRSFVASFGNDANVASLCTLASPCRSFTAAQGVTDANGEIIALDAAGYGAITITKSISIIANPGVYAGISASTGNAVTIATAGVNVTLRGLNINGVGATTGIRMTNGSRLTVENCVISNFSVRAVHITGAFDVRVIGTVVRDNGLGFWVEDGVSATITGSHFRGSGDSGVIVWSTGAAVTTQVAISDSVISDNGVSGLVTSLIPAGATTRTTVTRSTLSNNGVYGIYTGTNGGSAIVSISYSALSGNGTALNNASGTIRTQSNNTIENNGTATSGTITGFTGS